MNLLFLLFPLVFINPATDSSSAKLHIEIENQEVNSIDIKLFTDPITYDTFAFNSSKKIKGGKRFDILLPLVQTTFIELRVNKRKEMALVVAPGDSISVKLGRIQDRNYISYNFTISGSNANAHEIYNGRFTPPGRNFDFFDSLYQLPSTTYGNFYIESKKYIDSITQIWDSLKANHLITPDVYKLYKADTKACLYNEAVIKLARIKMDTTWTNYVKWLNIRDVMFFHGDAANKMLLKTRQGIQLHDTYLLSILREDDYVTDTLIKTTQKGYFYYYDTLHREQYWGNDLWKIAKQFPLPWISEIDMNELIAFKTYYPNSVYLKEMQAPYDSVLNEREKLPDCIIINENTVQTMRDIFKSMNGRFYFIDIWATWCNPCIEELNYYTADFYAFLKEKKIKNIFLSVDKIENKGIWKTLIKDHYIKGMHYIISSEVKKELSTILSESKKEKKFMIPQYLFYDKVKDKYYTGLPHPREKKALRLFIQNIINK